jgi:PAS domain S-box-containing protein
MNKFVKVFKTSKILIPVFLTSILLGVFLYFYIPIVMEDGMLKNMVKHSKNDVQRLQLQREYYVSSVVKDIKKFAPNITFDYNHKGVNGKLPFPTTVVHDLTKLYSERTDIKFALYSEFPFKNRKDRVLTDFQKKAIKMVEKSPNGIYYQKDFIDGKEVLRVAVADYMTQQACVNCHNHSNLRTWSEDKWKLGDKRGVLEIITPIDTELAEMTLARNKVLAASTILMLLLIIYYSVILLKREQELNNENEKLNDNFNDLFEDFDKYVIASKTDLKGNITYVSNKFCEISEYTKEELIGTNHSILRHEDMPDEVFKDMWNIISKEDSWEGEIKNKTKSGGYYWVNANISPLYRDEKHIGYVAIRSDITDKKKIDELNESLQKRITKELEKSRKKDQQMIEQSRLAQMGEMISMIAHQWRQPLNAISSASAVITLKAKRDKLEPSMALELASKISQYSQHLSVTIDDFREFFKSNKTKKETNFKIILNSVNNIVEESITNKNIKLIHDVHCDSSFESYENELKQVLLNLIKNAEDVLLENKIEDAYIKITTYSKDDEYVLEVSDNAGGVPEDIIGKIFDPYFSTKTQKDGTGLGLYMSKMIIEDHCKGKLTVTNNENGALFKIVIKTLA